MPHGKFFILHSSFFIPFFVFPRRVKARTILPRVQVPVTHDEGAGEHPFQFAQQRFQGYFLRHGARVPRMAFAVQSPFVADADAVAVVVQAVRPYPLQRTAVVYHPVARDVEVVADVTEAAVADVVRAALFKIKALPLAGGRAMKDNQRDGSHRPTQDEMPNTPARAVATATIALSTMLHTVFLVVVVAITLDFLLVNDNLALCFMAHR